jgi:hypothetical protein
MLSILKISSKLREFEIFELENRGEDGKRLWKYRIIIIPTTYSVY